MIIYFHCCGTSPPLSSTETPFGPTSAMSVAMSLMRVPSRIGDSAATIAFESWGRRFGSDINRLRSASFGVPLVQFRFLRFGADLRGMRTFSTRDCNPILVPLRGPADINPADESAVRLLYQDIIQTCLFLAAVGAMERVGHATFGSAKKSVQKSACCFLRNPAVVGHFR